MDYGRREGGGLECLGQDGPRRRGPTLHGQADHGRHMDGAVRKVQGAPVHGRDLPRRTVQHDLDVRPERGYPARDRSLGLPRREVALPDAKTALLGERVWSNLELIEGALSTFTELGVPDGDRIGAGSQCTALPARVR